MFRDLVNVPVVKSLFAALKKVPLDEVFLVGGVVRDFILTQKISNDIDVATNLSIDEVIKRLPMVGQGKMLTNAVSYGSVSFFIEGFGITVTKFRQDVETFGRSAVVKSVEDVKSDASRRDFTINALYLDQDGNLLDFFEGAADLSLRRVVFIGDAEKRIVEDYLRILRFFRFSSRFTNYYDTKTLATISRTSGGLRGVSLERITMEMSEIIQNEFAIPAIKNMLKCGIFKILCGKEIEVDFAIFAKMLGIFHSKKDYFDPLFGLLPFFIAISYEDALTMMSKMVLSNAQRSLILMVKENQNILYLHQLSLQEKINTIKLWLKHKELYNVVQFNPYISEELTQCLSDYVRMPLTGADIIAAFPDVNKKMIRYIMEEMQAKWISSGYNASRDQLISIAYLLIESVGGGHMQ